MKQVLEWWKNRAGQVVVKHERGLEVLPPGQTAEQWAAGPPTAQGAQFVTPDGRMLAVQSAGATRAFVLPRLPDGTGGDVIEAAWARRGTPRYAAPVAYFATHEDAAALEAEAARLRRERDAAAGWVAKQRVEAALAEVERRLRGVKLDALVAVRRRERGPVP